MASEGSDQRRRLWPLCSIVENCLAYSYNKTCWRRVKPLPDSNEICVLFVEDNVVQETGRLRLLDAVIIAGERRQCGGCTGSRDDAAGEL